MENKLHFTSTLIITQKEKKEKKEKI